MTKRPCFIPDPQSDNMVVEKEIEFTWFPGFAVSQKQKSINSFHQNISELLNTTKILEISTKSPEDLGVQCSAFNLMLEVNDHILGGELL